MVLINAEMPKNCISCRIGDNVPNCPCKGSTIVFDYCDKRHSDCPLIDIPLTQKELLTALNDIRCICGTSASIYGNDDPHEENLDWKHRQLKYSRIANDLMDKLEEQNDSN